MKVGLWKRLKEDFSVNRIALLVLFFSLAIVAGECITANLTQQKDDDAIKTAEGITITILSAGQNGCTELWLEPNYYLLITDSVENILSQSEITGSLEYVPQEKYDYTTDFLISTGMNIGDRIIIDGEITEDMLLSLYATPNSAVIEVRCGDYVNTYDVSQYPVGEYFTIQPLGSSEATKTTVSMPEWLVLLLALLAVLIAWILSVLLRKSIPEKDQSAPLMISAATGWLTSMLLPLVPLAYLFGRNVTELNAWQVLILAALLGVITSSGYIIALFATRSKAMGVMNALYMTILFFCFGPLYTLFCSLIAASGETVSVLGLFLTLMVLLLISAIYVRFIHKRSQGATCVISLICGFMLLMNIIPLGRNLVVRPQNENAVKTDFEVDVNTESPNIYWFLCDGMMNFRTMETYYDDPQTELKDQLTQRGFFINPDAEFEAAHNTVCAIPTLMCPGFYDAKLANVMPVATPQIARSMLMSNLDLFYHARENNELIAAFMKKGYETSIIGSADKTYFFPVTDRYYTVRSSSADTLANMSYLPKQYRSYAQNYFSRLTDVLGLGKLGSVIGDMIFDMPADAAVPFSTVLTDQEVDVLLGSALYRDKNSQAVYQVCTNYMRMLYDSFDSASPRLTIVHYMEAHRPFLRQLNIPGFSNDAEDIRNYHAQHEYAGQLLIALCDMIIAKDSDAVIVLQADHGIHKEEFAQQVSALYGKDTPIKDFFNSTFSCVRIPDALKGGNEAQLFENPLNISRYLVNSFVGDNYKYLQSNEREGV